MPRQNLPRSFAALKAELETLYESFMALRIPPRIFISYTLTDTQRANRFPVRNGALLSSDEGRNRWLEVAVRTGEL